MGLLIREALSFWTGHPYDMEVWIRNAYFVSQGQNPYSAFMPPVPGLSFAFLNYSLPGVGYLPLWPLVVAGLYRLYAIVPGTSRFVLYFLLKQPPVLGDTLLGYLLYRALLAWGGKTGLALRGLKFWMFFPYAIVISAIWGMFDAVVAVLFFGFLLSNRTWKGYLGVGLGILLKWFPLIFLPLYFLREKGLRRFGVVFAVAVATGLTAFAFWATGWDYIGVTAMAQYASHGGRGGMTYTSLVSALLFLPALSGLSYLWYLLGFMWVPGIIVAAIVAIRRFPDSSAENTVQALLLVTSVFFLTRLGVNEQYLTYLLPPFYVDVVLWHPERRSLFTLTWALSLSFLLADNDVLVRFFGPAFPQALDVAFAFDNYSEFAWIRYSAMYVIGVLFTIHLVQLVWIFLDPRRNPTPWLWRPFARLRSPSRQRPTEVLGDP
jgi:hypothetical protein